MSYKLGDLPCPYHHGMTLFECQDLHPRGPAEAQEQQLNAEYVIREPLEDDD